MGDWWVDESLPVGPVREPREKVHLELTGDEWKNYKTKQHGLAEILLNPNGDPLGILFEVEIVTRFWDGKKTYVYKYETWEEEDW